MSHVIRICVAGVTALAAAFSSANVAAEEVQAQAVVVVVEATPAPVPIPAATKAAESVVVAAAEPANLMGMKPLDLKTLEKRRGAADVYNDMQLKGVVANNQAINVATGNNLITDGAFAGTAGVPMVVQNSGSNVLIQNATIVNVQVK